MPDRSKRPEFKLTKNIPIPQLNSVTLSNNINLSYINIDYPDFISLYLIFRGGSWVQNKPLVASTTVKNIPAGTSSLSESQIAETFSFYATKVNFFSTYRYSIISISLLQQNLEPVLQLLNQLITDPTFPEKELKIYLNNEKQSYIIDLQEPETIAENLFLASIFGKNHPYGLYASPEDYDKVSRQDVLNYFKKVFNSSNLSLFAGGNITDKTIKLFDKYLTNLPKNKRIEFKQFPISPEKNKNIYIDKPDSVQAAIMLGEQTINVYHPDFIPLVFTVMALGGYFGSRLMQNIREQKGLTYGIWAYIDKYYEHSVLTIEASVKKENKQIVIDEIAKEIKKLKNHGVSDKELLTIKNSFISSQLETLSDKIDMINYMRKLYIYGLQPDHLNFVIKQVLDMTNDKLIEIANKYICFDNFYKIIVG
jgi:predicted Zn-dependent peptidase